MGVDMSLQQKLTIRKADERGVAEHGWLHSRHTFSFANYYDPNHMGFRSLRVINDDVIERGEGFGTHPHSNMEIITYVVEGALEHRDSMGNGSIIRANDVQRMSAGSGVTHSEFNPQQDQSVRLLQIWIQPEEMGLEPGYEQKFFSRAEKTNVLKLVASPDGVNGSVRIHQDVRLYASVLEPGAELVLPFNPQRYIWVQVVSGSLTVNGALVETGDGVALENATELQLKGFSSAEVLVFDLA